MYKENSFEDNQSQEQNPIEDSYSMFNSPISVDDFDDEEVPLSKDFWSDTSEDPEPTDPVDDEVDLGDDPDDSAEDDLTFEDDVLGEQEASQEAKSDEELRAELEKRGYKVAKEDENDKGNQRTQEISRLSSMIEDGKKFLELPAETIVREKVRANLSREYQQTGRGNLIGGEDFIMELESEFDQYSQNNALLNIYADNIKTEVKNVINGTESQLNAINAEVAQENKKALIEKRTNLQGAIKSIHKSGIFGIKPTPQESQEIYQSIISGELTKTVNSDPNLVAEFGTFLKFREKINAKLGGPSYGEGVKNAVEAINGGTLKTESSLRKAVKSTAPGVTGSGEQSNRNNSWSMNYVPLEEDKDQNSLVAGRGAGFL